MSGEIMQKCVQALKGTGCQVTFEDGGKGVRVVFPDGVVKEYSTTFFTLMVTKVLMEEAEQLGQS
jgi:hypothetical protein